MRLIGWFVCLSLTSCGIYKSSFDCPPGKGIGCTPVNEVLNFIVEREEGEDLFIPDLGRALILKEPGDAVPPTKKKFFLVKGTSGEVLFKEKREAD